MHSEKGYSFLAPPWQRVVENTDDFKNQRGDEFMANRRIDGDWYVCYIYRN